MDTESFKQFVDYQFPLTFLLRLIFICVYRSLHNFLLLFRDWFLQWVLFPIIWIWHQISPLLPPEGEETQNIIPKTEAAPVRPIVIRKEKCEVQMTRIRIIPDEQIIIEGLILPGCSDFYVQLGKDEDNIFFHYNVRFAKHEDLNAIVCNAKTDGTWGEEVRPPNFPICDDSLITMIFTFTSETISAQIVGFDTLVFNRRETEPAITFLMIRGDFKTMGVKLS